METITRRRKELTLKKQISFRVLEKDLELIQEVKSSIDVNLSMSDFLRFLVKESIHFQWYNKTENPNNLKMIQ